MKKGGFILILSVFSLNITAQHTFKKQRCGTDEYHKVLSENTPNYYRERRNTNNQIQEQFYYFLQ